MMDAIFADMIDDNIVIIYMDNIFIYAPDEETLAKNTRRVLGRLRDNDLFLKLVFGSQSWDWQKTRTGLDLN